MSSLDKLVPRARLRVRSLQWRLKTSWSSENDSPTYQYSGPSRWTGTSNGGRRETTSSRGSPPPKLCLYSDTSKLGIGTIVEPGDIATHQHLGDESSVPSTSGFSGHGHRPAGYCNVRQLHGCGLCHQSGRDSVRLPLRVDRATSPLDGSPQRAPRSEIPAWTVERPSRSPQVLGAEWSLHPQVAKKIIRTWGSPTIDLFAT